MRLINYLPILVVVLVATCCQGGNPLDKIKKIVAGSGDSGKLLRLEFGRSGGPAHRTGASDGAMTVWREQPDRPQPTAWSAHHAIVPFDPSRTSQEVPEHFFRREEKTPPVEMSDDGLRLVTKELFVWNDKLTSEDVIEKLEQLDPSYERIKRRLPLDTRELLSFSQEIEAHCQDKKFYDRMVKAMKIVEKSHRALVNYMKECLANYQFTCQSDLTLTDQVTEFRRNNGAGLKLLELLRIRMAENRGHYQPYQLGVYSLGQIRDRHEWGGKKGNALFIETCTKIRAFREQNHLERMDPAWRNDENIGSFMIYVDICRDLERENYKDYLNR